MAEKFDLIVVGGGRAANLAIAAGKSGLKVALIEKDKLGGTCPNRGCVPSKLLLGFAEAARQVQGAENHFISANYKGADLAAIFESVNTYITAVDPRYEARLPDTVELLRDEARFTGKRIIRAAGRELTSDNIVIATGSRPVQPPFAALPVWTSDSLFPMKDVLPESLLVVGAGFIGCEMASFFSAVGVKTTLLSRSERLLSKEDTQIEEVFRKEFSRYVDTRYNATLTDLTYDGTAFTATIDEAGNTTMLQIDNVLFATGRIPNTVPLNLGATGVEVDSKGFITVNDQLETNVSGIYAAGDVNGRYMLQHAASYEIHYLRRKLIRGVQGPINDVHIAHGVYGIPEVAAVGYTEQQLQEQNIPYVSIFEDWQVSARAMARREKYPRIKLLVSPEDYSILGCHLIGQESDTLLHQVLTVMHLKNDVRELAEMVYIHPALNECILAASVKAVAAVRRYQNE
ncbi:dihydrolipoyl dehydrogenase family protein [Desulforhopalus sp. 52FAK]